ncbi:MAG: hypothetical protein OXH99_01265 [Bryobacterales bacterium]|nr:hypothetical protein [Bryobacterales bacterium]
MAEFQYGKTNFVAVGSDQHMLSVYEILPGGKRLERAGDLWYPACMRFMPYARTVSPLRRRSATWIRRRWGRLTGVTMMQGQDHHGES